MIWVLVLELWSMNEERLQLAKDPSLRHDVGAELGLYQRLGEMFAGKLEALYKAEDKRRDSLRLGQNLASSNECAGLLSLLRAKIDENSSPSAKQSATALLGPSDTQTPKQ